MSGCLKGLSGCTVFSLESSRLNAGLGTGLRFDAAAAGAAAACRLAESDTFLRDTAFLDDVDDVEVGAPR